LFKIALFIIVRACHKCREYVHINPVDPNNQRLIKIFESNHAGHPIVSVNLSEVKDYYENVEKKIMEELNSQKT